MADSPYKFLDYYDFNQKNPEPFFGRQRETQILLSDILVSRLVVLFAQTGTGKTSLINAGVRPLLEKRGYKHVLIRVRDDPSESARAELRTYLGMETLEGNTFPEQLRWVKNQLDHPLVLFFDQFEEFFLKRPTPENKQIASQFVSDIAELYENADSGIHIVFSMREDWFVKMDLFREHIPELFNNESSLRLRFFQPQQAREAIVGPANSVGVKIKSELVAQVISDITNNDGEIEPAQLQIVCDTLWLNKARSKVIDLDDYHALGRKYAISRRQREANISQRILTGRLVEAFEQLDSEMDLQLLSRLLPELCTEENTKSFRDLDGLAQGLGISKDEIRPLIKYLNSCGLIRILDRGDVTFVELAHDYLAHRQRLNNLRERIDAIWPRKLLEDARATASEEWLNDLTKDFRADREARLSPENLKKISDKASIADCDASQLHFLFRWALSRGDESQVELWFQEASKQEVPVWTTLDTIIRSSHGFSEAAGNAIRLLGRLHDERIWPLLSIALERSDLAPIAIDVLGDIPKPEAVQMLKPILETELAHEAITALGRLRMTDAIDVLGGALQKPALAKGAELVLERISKGRPDEVSSRARSILDQREHAPTPKSSTPESIPSGRVDIHEADWEVLLRRIRDGRCTPIIGPGLIPNQIQERKKLSQRWAKEYGYPFNDSADLSKVAQFLNVSYGDAEYALEKFVEYLQTLSSPIANVPEDPHTVLAALPLPVYVTTAYDDSLEQALKNQNRLPRHDYCRWNRLLDEPSILDSFRPTAAEPLVFHLYGISWQPRSLVLTEDDYFNYLINTSKDQRLIPPIIERSLTGNSLILIGHQMDELGSKVLIQMLLGFVRAYPGKTHIFVQPLDFQSVSEDQVLKVQEYVKRYFERTYRIYWGTGQDFTNELKKRWEASGISK